MADSNIEIISNIKDQKILYNHRLKKYIFNGLYYFDSLLEVYAFQSKISERIRKSKEGRR